MNGVLYLLTGCCVAGAIVAAFFVRVDIARVSTTDATAAFWFLLALAAAFFFLAYTRWGRMWRSRVDKKAADEDKRVRETVGKVRQPPFDLGSWP